MYKCNRKGGNLLYEEGKQMKLKEIMTESVIGIHPDESVAVAARMFTHYNI